MNLNFYAQTKPSNAFINVSFTFFKAKFVELYDWSMFLFNLAN